MDEKQVETMKWTLKLQAFFACVYAWLGRTIKTTILALVAAAFALIAVATAFLTYNLLYNYVFVLEVLPKIQ